MLKIYQKFFTLIGFGSCRYYPSCSEYSKWQVLHNNSLKAIIFSIFRILKCNQLFEGGFDYPIVKRKLDDIEFKSQPIEIDYWFIPTKKKNQFYVIKNIFKKVS